MDLTNIKLGLIPMGLQFSSENPEIKRIDNLMACRFIPTFGISSSAADTLNILAEAQYTYVRHYNSGSRNYQASDLFQYELATISLHLFILYCIKTYGIMTLYSKNHRVLPQLMAGALNIDLDDLVANKKDFHAWINLCIKRLASFVIPGDLKVFARWSSLTQGIYCDDYEEGQTQQYYTLDPAGFYLYDWENATLKYFDRINDMCDGDSNYKLTFAELRNTFENFIGQLTHSDDVGTISGDLLKAYKDNYFEVHPISDDYEVPIVRTTNAQMATVLNMDYFDAYSTFNIEDYKSTFNITQENDILKFQPKVILSEVNGSIQTNNETHNLTFARACDRFRDRINRLNGSETALNFLSADISDEEVVEAIRAKFCYDVSNDNYYEWRKVTDDTAKLWYLVATIQACGSEMWVTPTIYRYDPSTGSDEFYNLAEYHLDLYNAALYVGSNQGGVFNNIYANEIYQGSLCTELSNCVRHYFFYGAVAAGSLPEVIATDTYLVVNRVVQNLRFLPDSTIKYALVDDNWENIVNDLWLTRKR